MSEENKHFVAVIGAGPAGLFGARELANHGCQVVLFNRDIKPGGLAEYGIYPDKHTMKDGLRKQFHQVLDNPNIVYYGNVRIGAHGDLTLDDLRGLGFQAMLITVGAQGTKWLGLPGENLRGVYHAKDVVYYYNKLPPFSQKEFYFGKRCAIIGAGNVMVDIARYLIRDQKVDEVISIVRRGPAEVNFTKEEFKHIVAQLDLAAFETELRRVLPALEAVHEGTDIGREKILSALPKGDPKFSDTRFRFEFLSSPVGMLGQNGKVTGLEIEDNVLVEKDGELKARGTGHRRVLPVDTVIFAIGDRVDASFGLPVASNEFVKNPAPRFPVENLSYEAYDPAAQAAIPDVFVGGWSRQASEGLVGVARKDGTNAARAVEQYLQTLPAGQSGLQRLANKMKGLNRPVITGDELQKLEAVENDEARKRGAEEFKFASNEEMLQALGLQAVTADSAD